MISNELMHNTFPIFLAFLLFLKVSPKSESFINKRNLIVKGLKSLKWSKKWKKQKEFIGKF